MRATGSDPILSCTRLLCRDPRFALTGDLLLNGNAWTFKPGTWWGITVTPRPGLTLDRVIYNSRMAGWVATSNSQASILTTQGYANEPATKSTTAALSAGVQTGYDTGAFGGEGQLRPAMRVLDYATAIDGAHLFTVTLPLPRWARP